MLGNHTSLKGLLHIVKYTTDTSRKLSNTRFCYNKSMGNIAKNGITSVSEVERIVIEKEAEDDDDD